MPGPTALPTATAVLEGAAELAGAAWSDLDGPDAVAAAAALGRIKALVDGALVEVAQRLGETDAAAEAGWASTKDFLTHVLGGRKGAGGGLVRLAERTTALPAVRAALCAGEISLAQASAISGRVATLPRVPELREQAAALMLDLVADRSCDATDLDRAFPDVVRTLDPDGSLLRADLDKDRAERGAHHARFLSFSPDTLGGVRIKGYATLEETELVKACLMPLAAPVTTQPGACGASPVRGLDPETGRHIGHGCPDPDCFHDGKDPRDHGTRLWDALVEACTRLQATDTLPHAHGSTARLTLTMNLDDLTTRLDNTEHIAGEGLLPTGDRLSATAVRRLACDAEIIPAVLGTHGQVLDLGRTSRLVTPGLWHALVLRDQHCAFPGCTRLPIACDAHHITHWADGGPTSLDNLVLLCRRHHTTTHHTPWTLAIDPHTHKPVWTPPPPIDDTHRFSYAPATRPPLVA